MNTYKRHRFPPDIISYAVWLYYRFNLSHREINDDHEEGQHTVVTETSGSLKGKRVARGLEAECHLYYEKSTARAGIN